MIQFRVLCRIILLEVFLVNIGLCEDYMLGFNEGFTACKDFSNEIFKGDDMKIGKSSEDEEETTYLVGCLEFIEEVGEGIMISVEIEKETEMGSEPMWSFSGGVCDTLFGDPDAPWVSAMHMMNLTECPIAPGKYCAPRFELDLGCLNDKLNHEWEGTYGTLLKLKNDNMDVTACHMMGLVIKEVDRK